MKITTIFDNHCGNCSLQEGWGFSALIEKGDFKILFDTGGDEEAFFANCAKLGIDLQSITHVVFSHRHHDHIAGHQALFSKLKEGTQIFLPKCFFKRSFKDARLTFKTIDAFEEVLPNVYSCVMKGGFFLYEQALIFVEPEGSVIITGCAHPGILQIIKTVQNRLGPRVHLVLGGFHLAFSTSQKAASVVSQFQDLHVQKVAPCHCTGQHTIRKFKEAYQDNFIEIGTGSIIKV